MAYYIFRIDDVHPDMNWDQFNKYISLFAKNGVVPLLGVIPDNKDSTLIYKANDRDFWKEILDLYEKHLVEISMHGYQHKYVTNNGGILGKYGFRKQSEFAGLDLEEQEYKISMGKQILSGKGLDTNIFMAPGHTFDKNTINSLIKNNFKYITDGTGLFPYYYNNILLVPQQIAVPRKMPFGVITICLHIDKMDHENYIQIQKFIEQNRDKIVSFSEVISKKYPFSSILNFLFKIAYFILSKIKRRN